MRDNSKDNQFNNKLYLIIWLNGDKQIKMF